MTVNVMLGILETDLIVLVSKSFIHVSKIFFLFLITYCVCHLYKRFRQQ